MRVRLRPIRLTVSLSARLRSVAYLFVSHTPHLRRSFGHHILLCRRATAPLRASPSSPGASLRDQPPRSIPTHAGGGGARRAQCEAPPALHEKPLVRPAPWGRRHDHKPPPSPAEGPPPLLPRGRRGMEPPGQRFSLARRCSCAGVSHGTATRSCCCRRPHRPPVRGVSVLPLLLRRLPLRPPPLPVSHRRGGRHNRRPPVTVRRRHAQRGHGGEGREGARHHGEAGLGVWAGSLPA